MTTALFPARAAAKRYAPGETEVVALAGVDLAITLLAGSGADTGSPQKVRWISQKRANEAQP